MSFHSDLEFKRLILNRIVGSYATEGPLPPLKELNSCISQMDPQELARAIYVLEYNDCRSALAHSGYLIPNKKFENTIYSSKEIKNDIEKLFMAVAEHFKRVPGEASEMVDQMFHYFYQTLVHLATKQGLTSLN